VTVTAVWHDVGTTPCIRVWVWVCPSNERNVLTQIDANGDVGWRKFIRCGDGPKLNLFIYFVNV